MIETERLIIRPLTIEDAADLFAVLSNETVMAYIQAPFSYTEAKTFIQNLGLCSPPHIYAIQQKGNGLIGHIIYHTYDSPSCFELGWILAEEYWHQGYASEITQAIISYAIKNGLSKLIIECDPAQKASKQIALSHGFIFCGIQDNLEIYQLDLG